jgi:orotate phosphoribosyltransferase
MTTRTEKDLEKLKDMIAEMGVAHASDEQPIMSPRGSKQKWLIDLRPVLLNTEALNIITDIFWDQFEEDLPFQIGGMEVAAVPLVTALLMKAEQRGLKTNGFIIRKERKTSGLGKIIEGQLNDNPIILVDDIFNSGSSLDKARAAIEQVGREISQIFVILNYESVSGKDWQNRQNVLVNYLFNLDPFEVELFPRDYNPPKMDYKVLWRFYEPGAFPFHIVPKSTPLLVGDHLYMGTESGKMCCIDRKTGKAVWKFDTKTHHPKGIWSSPAHHDGKIFFGAYNGIAYCLDAKTGEEVWRNPCAEFIGSSPLIVPEKGMMYLGLEHQRPRQMGSNAAFNIKTSERVWERAQKKYQHGSAAYYAPKNLVIFGNADHDVTAYDADSGKLIWKHETIRSIKYPPAIDEERKLVVATSFDGNIYILDAETGKRKAAIETNDICYTTPLITNGKIFAGSGDRHLYVIDANNFKLIEKIDMHARVYSSPKLIDGLVMFGTGGGRLVEINPDTLKIESHAQMADAITNAISATPKGDVLYVSTVMNELYAVERTKVS